MGKLLYNLKFIALKKLSVIWQESQRPLNERWADEIAETFDPDLFAPVDVTKPNCEDMHHVIDGQHRVAAAKKALGEDQTIPCRVFDFNDPAVAADMFSRINEKRKRPHQIDMFRTKVTAGHEDEVAVNRIVNKNGFTVGLNSLTSISCPSALLGVYRRFGGGVLTETIQILSACYGATTESMVANNIKGFGAFLAEYRGANTGHLVKVVKKRYPNTGQLAAAVKQYKDLNSIVGVDRAVMAVLVGAYNRGSRAKLRLPF